MQPDGFDLLSEIEEIETIAISGSIREREYLNRRYGRARWRKRKGVAVIRYHQTNRVVKAELHWYEAHGVGAVKWKVKREIER